MIDFIFSIINFLILVFLGYYFFKKYFLKSLKAKFYSYLYEKKELELLRQKTAAQAIELDQVIINQNIKCGKLKGKVDLWQKEVKNSEIEQNNQKEALLEKFKENLDFKFQQYHKRNLKIEVSKSLVKTLEKDLKKYFDIKTNAHTYLSSLIFKLDRKGTTK